MSSAPARLLFVVVLIINAILWSHSRYADTSRVQAAYADQGLVKRISYGLLNPNATLLQEGSNAQCHPRSVPLLDQCSHVRENCMVSETFLSLDYLRYYFCADTTLKPVVFGGLVVWLIFLFSTLGISASDFLVPNLATISHVLGLSEDVAGVTFLAFGNASPDVFSTFSAMRANSGSLAIGELLGAASFIVSCVVGSMCIIRPFQVERWPFLRDVGFFTAAVLALLVILWDGHIRKSEAGAMVALYFLYVIVVIVGEWWDRRRSRRLQYESQIRSEYDEEDVIFTEYRDDPSPVASTVASPLPPRARATSHPGPGLGPLRLQTDFQSWSRTSSPGPSPRHHHPSLPSFSLVGAIEFRDVVQSLQHQAASPALSIFDTQVTPYAGGHYHSPNLLSRTPGGSVHDLEVNPFDAALGSLPLDDRTANNLLSTPAPGEEPGDLLLDVTHLAPPGRPTPVPSIYRTPASPTVSNIHSDSTSHYPSTRWGSFKRISAKTFHTLFPTLHHFPTHSILAGLAALFAAPAVMLLTITLPVVVTPQDEGSIHNDKLNDAPLLHGFDGDDESRVLQSEVPELSYNKWLTAAQCIFGPVFCACVLFAGADEDQPLIIAGTAAGGIIAALLVLVFSTDGRNPTMRMARCSIGFVVAVVWVMAIADEVVQLLRTFGYIFGLSDAMIGLTVFAVGNSLADLVANTSVAVFAPLMGFSACFGGPMLNILLGVGLSGSYIIHHTSEPYTLQYSTTLFVSTIGLLALLVTTLVFVPLNHYYLTRSWGIFLIVSYSVIMAISIIVELRGT